jgi:uncharacterized heparinase superfamily protein
MSGVSVAERTRLSWLLMRRALRSAAGRLNANPILRWRYLSPKTDRLVIAPQELRTTDATRAAEFYAGRFAFAGKIVVCDRRSPFEMTPPSDEWAAELLGFGWLRHLRAADSGIARANARALVDEWITIQGSWDDAGWRPDILARRVISWLVQSPLVLHEADVQFYRRFLRSLSRQVRYLRNAAGDARDGIAQIQIGIALCYACLCMAGQARHLSAATRKLIGELNRQILPDGGHVGRNPGIGAELLLDLLPLRQAFSSRNIAPPVELLNAIDRMMPMLRFFRHGDGNFALFNGMGPTATADVATVLAYDDARGTPVANAPHSGYQRMQLNELMAIVDTGTPPPLGLSQEAHAGCLAFELSSGSQRIIVNCGMTAINRESWRQLARATAAHSTVTFNDASSCRFREIRAFRKLIGVPIVSGPKHVTVEREDHADALILHASHDGYADRYGIIHRRMLTLLENGRRIEGEDTFLSPRGGTLPADAPDEYAIRFHLHPSIKANRLADAHSVMLTLPSREVWSFDAHEDHVDLEESVYLAGNEGPRRTVQIVILGKAGHGPRVHWTISQTARTAPAQSPSRRDRSNEPELPLE